MMRQPRWAICIHKYVSPLCLVSCSLWLFLLVETGFSSNETTSTSNETTPTSNETDCYNGAVGDLWITGATFMEVVVSVVILMIIAGEESGDVGGFVFIGVIALIIAIVLLAVAGTSVPCDECIRYDAAPSYESAGIILICVSAVWVFVNFFIKGIDDAYVFSIPLYGWVACIGVNLIVYAEMVISNCDNTTGIHNTSADLIALHGTAVDFEAIERNADTCSKLNISGGVFVAVGVLGLWLPVVDAVNPDELRRPMALFCVGFVVLGICLFIGGAAGPCDVSTIPLIDGSVTDNIDVCLQDEPAGYYLGGGMTLILSVGFACLLPIFKDEGPACFLLMLSFALGVTGVSLTMFAAFAIPCDIITTVCTHAETMDPFWITGGVLVGVGCIFMFFSFIAGCKEREHEWFILGLVGGLTFIFMGLTPIIYGSQVVLCNDTDPLEREQLGLELAKTIGTANPRILFAGVTFGATAMLLKLIIFCTNAKEDRIDKGFVVIMIIVTILLYIATAVLFGVFMQSVSWDVECTQSLVMKPFLCLLASALWQLPFDASIGMFFTLMFISGSAVMLLLHKFENRRWCVLSSVGFWIAWLPMIGCLAGMMLSCEPLLVGNSTYLNGILSESDYFANLSCIVTESQLPRMCEGTSAQNCSHSCQIGETLYLLDYFIFDSEFATNSGLVACSQPDNFCGLWDHYNTAHEVPVNDTGSIDRSMCQQDSFAAGGSRYYLKYNIQYYQASGFRDYVAAVLLSSSAAIPFWVNPTFAWQAVPYRAVDQAGQDCSEQFQLQCLALEEAEHSQWNSVNEYDYMGSYYEDQRGALHNLQKFAEGVSYRALSPVESSTKVRGYNEHDTLAGAIQECASDCDCTGIILAETRDEQIWSIVLGIILGVPLLMCVCTVTKVWPFPFCHRFMMLTVSFVKRKERKADLDEALKNQRWLSQGRVIEKHTLWNWANRPNEYADLEMTPGEVYDMTKEEIDDEVDFFLNDVNLVSEVQRIHDAILDEQQNMLESGFSQVQQDTFGLATRKTISIKLDAKAGSKLDEMFEKACMYFAARRRRAFNSLRNSKIASKLVRRLKTLSEDFVSTYEVLLEKYAFHDTFYLKVLGPLCRNMNENARDLLNMSTQEQMEANFKARKINSEAEEQKKIPGTSVYCRSKKDGKIYPGVVEKFVEAPVETNSQVIIRIFKSRGGFTIMARYKKFYGYPEKPTSITSSQAKSKNKRTLAKRAKRKQNEKLENSTKVNNKDIPKWAGKTEIITAKTDEIFFICLRVYEERVRKRYRFPHWTQRVSRIFNDTQLMRMKKVNASHTDKVAPDQSENAIMQSHQLDTQIVTFSTVFRDAMHVLVNHYIRTMVEIGRYSDLAEGYTDKQAMQKLEILLRKKVIGDDVSAQLKGLQHVSIASLKKAWRCAEKALDRTDDHAGTPVYLTDIVRGQLLFQNIRNLYDAIHALSRYERVVVTRVKDRIGTPANGGWADILVNVFHQADEKQHCCEIQFVLEPLLNTRKHGGHADFNKFRSGFEVLESTFNQHLMSEQKCGPPCQSLVAYCTNGRKKKSAKKNNDSQNGGPISKQTASEGDVESQSDFGQHYIYDSQWKKAGSTSRI